MGFQIGYLGLSFLIQEKLLEARCEEGWYDKITKAANGGN